MSKPLIVFVPGLRPKPEPTVHRREMLRCLVRGVSRIDGRVASQIESDEESFEIVPWNYPFYGSYHDIELDRAGIEYVLERSEAAPEDIAEARSFRRRVTIAAYRIVNHLPFLMPRLANEKLQLHLREYGRYVRNRDGIAGSTREFLKHPLLKARRNNRPILLIGHSMGSVIAYDCLWELTHRTPEPFEMNTFLTLGSPLGQHYIQQRLFGHDQSGRERYPGNIGRWINIAAVGELTAIYPELATDFADMVSFGLVGAIEDLECFNFLRNGGAGGELNVHSEYGYLVNPVVAGAIAEWWLRASSDPGSA